MISLDDFLALPPIVITMMGREYKLSPKFSAQRVAFFSTERIEMWVDTPEGKIKLTGRFTMPVQKGLVEGTIP